jgi:hypothetical protein
MEIAHAFRSAELFRSLRGRGEAYAERAEGACACPSETKYKGP